MAGEGQEKGSASVPPDQQQQEQDEIQKAEASAKEEALRIANLKRQANVEESSDGQVIKIGVDIYDRWVKEFFELPAAPGYAANYSRDDFPAIKGEPIAVSRCYYNKREERFVVLDILDKDEYKQEQLNLIQSTLRSLGFHYAWTFRGEEVSLDEIFNTRMMAKNDVKPKPTAIRQTNVVNVQTQGA